MGIFFDGESSISNLGFEKPLNLKPIEIHNLLVAIKLSEKEMEETKDYDSLKKISKRINEDKKTILRAFLSYAYKIVSRHHCYSEIEPIDVFQFAMIGVSKAIDNFNIDLYKDCENNNAYIFKTINEEVKCGLNHNTNQFANISIETKKALPSIMKEVEKRTTRDMSSSEYYKTIEEVTNERNNSVKTKVDATEVWAALSFKPSFTLNNTLEDSEESFIDCISKDSRTSEDDAICNMAKEEVWDVVFSELPSDLAMIIYRVYVKEESQTSIAKDFGITKQALGKKLKKALSILEKGKLNEISDALYSSSVTSTPYYIA